MIQKHVTFRVRANKNIDWDDVKGHVVKIQVRKPEHLKDFVVNEVREAVNEFDMEVEASFVAQRSDGSPATICYAETPSGW